MNELRDRSKDKGFEFDLHRGSHYIMTKPGTARPVVIPMRRGLKERIELTVARAIGMTRSDLEIYIRFGGKSTRGKSRSR